ncbi:hypothetical protein [Streptomyces sp. NPDC003710]
MTDSHHTTVHPVRGGRRYEYRCSCGVKGWQVETSTQAQQQGQEHKAKKERG